MLLSMITDLAFNLKYTIRITRLLLLSFQILEYLLLTLPSFIQNHFKTLGLVCVNSSFYKAFVQFSSHSIELIFMK